jgi:hypothetical protein
MNRADPLDGTVAPQQNPITDVIVDLLEQRCEGTATSAAEPTPGMISPVVTRRPASPVRLTLASRLGDEIDGAWWPRTGQISRELPELVSVLDVRLGRIIDINVNWSSLQRPPDLNWDGWRGIHQHVMTLSGRDARAKLLIVPHRTGTALAVMVLLFAYPSIRRIATPGHSRPPNALSASPEAKQCLKDAAHGEMIRRDTPRPREVRPSRATRRARVTPIVEGCAKPI